MRDLPNEILHNVFTIVADSDPGILSIILCNKHFRDIATRIVYKDFYLSIYLCDPTGIAISTAGLDGLIKNKGGNAALVETFTVSGMDEYGKWELDDSPETMVPIWLKVLAALNNMPRLRMFNWRIPNRFPIPALLETLLLMPTLKDLNLGFERDNDEPVYNYDIPITHVPQPGLLRFAAFLTVPELLRNGNDQSRYDLYEKSIVLIRKFLAQSPNIKVLRLSNDMCDDQRLLTNESTSYPMCRPCTIEISGPDIYAGVDLEAGVFTSGLISLESCSRMIITTASKYTATMWIDLFTENIKKTPGFLPNLKTFHVSNWHSSDSFCEGEFLRLLSGLEEIVVNASDIGTDMWLFEDLYFLNNHTQTLKKVFFGAPINSRALPALGRLQCLEDVGMFFRTEGGQTRVGNLAKTMNILSNLPNLRVFRISWDPDWDTPQASYAIPEMAISQIELDSSRDPAKWPALRFVCHLRIGEHWANPTKDKLFMRAWERAKKKNGTYKWRRPVMVPGRLLKTEEVEMVAGELTRQHDWDDWLIERNKALDQKLLAEAPVL